MANGKRSVIVGLGETGYSCARYFHARGLPFAVMDHAAAPRLLSRLREEMAEVEVVTGGLDAEQLLAAEQIVVSPGVPLTHAEIRRAAERGVPLTGDIDLFSRAAEQPIVAITGSNGKSSVTTLLGEIARACGVRAGVGGNLGPPALDLLDADCDLFVLEISSFQLETTRSLSAEVAVLLNLSPDHLDRYGSVAHYYATKARIFDGCRHAVIGAHDLPGVNLPVASTVWTFGPDRPGSDRAFGLLDTPRGLQLAKGVEPLAPVSDLAMRGRHNYLNALAALAVAEAERWPLDRALEAVRAFGGLAHRCESIAAVRGASYVNDSKATNVGATIAALESLGGELEGRRIILIAGGAGKGSDFAPLKDPVTRFVSAVVLLGEEAPRIAECLDGLVRMERAVSMEEAVTVAATIAGEGDLVLLSPACSSLDMFRNFEERGEEFRAAVQALDAVDGGEA